MQHLRTALGNFEILDEHEAPNPDTNPYDWEPPHWQPYPIPDDQVLNERPWIRPAQLPMSFVGVNVIDAEGSKVLENRTVKIRGGKIESIIKSADKDLQDEGYSCIDAKGLFMSPGLIDCHVHILYLSILGRWDTTDVTSAYRTAFNLKGILGNGFTTVRDVGGASRHHREATEEWLTPGPRLFIGGPVLSQTGGHGDHSDRDALPPAGSVANAYMGKVSVLVDGVDACLQMTRKLMMMGADHVKICSSGGVLSPTDKLDSSQFTVPEIKAVCDTVKSMGGTLVTAHCFTDQGARNAIEGGIGGIEHGSLIQESTLKIMAKRGIHFTPTLMITDVIVNGPMGKTIPKYSLEKAQMVADATYATIKKAHDLGVNIAYGTDCPFEIQLAEFELRKRILPSPAILKHATCNAAKVLGMEGKLGCIKQGAFADILLLDRNPLDDVGVFSDPRNLRAIIKDGRCVVSRVDGLKVEISLS